MPLPLLDFSALPRQPFRGRPLTRSQLLTTHRDPQHLYFRFEMWWWGSPPAHQRPHHFTIGIFNYRKQEFDKFSAEIDVVLWREPGTYWGYTTPKVAADALFHAGQRSLMSEKLLAAGSFIVSLN
jgi:hypothetical protein